MRCKKIDDIKNDGGFRIVLGNLIPCGGYAGCDDAKVNAFNASEADWCTDAGSRATCLDNYVLLGSGSETVTYSNAHVGFMGNLCLPTADNLHPNNYCTTKLADAFAGAAP